MLEQVEQATYIKNMPAMSEVSEMEIVRESPPSTMSVKQVAHFLGVCENTVRRLPIPYSQYVKGGRVIYQRQVVEQFKQANTHHPITR